MGNVRSLSIVVGFLVATAFAGAPLPAADLEANGDFEAGGPIGWTAWRATDWGSTPTYDYSAAESPDEGAASLHQSSTSGSFGVYQEVCVEPGEPISLIWSWKGSTSGNGFWEVMVVDAPYSLQAVNDPKTHPEAYVLEKWAVGFEAGLPGPAADWTEGEADLTPSSDVVTLVLKCGSSEGGYVEAWFDAVELTQDVSTLEIAAIAPALGKTAGGDLVTVTGRIFPEGSSATLGGKDLVDGARLGSCSLEGTTPPGDPGLVDVVVVTPDGNVTLVEGFRYVAPPVVTSVSPPAGPVEGGTDVVIEGESFVVGPGGSIQVKLGAVLLLETEIVSETEIRGKTPAGDAGPVGITITTPFGEVTVEEGFTYTEEGVRFVRGECDGNGESELTDAVVLLGYLFLGEEGEPPCLEACNFDDNDDLEITDAIGILGQLFLGEGDPPPPYPECGTDPTPATGPGCADSHAGC